MTRVNPEDLSRGETVTITIKAQVATATRREMRVRTASGAVIRLELESGNPRDGVVIDRAAPLLPREFGSLVRARYLGAGVVPDFTDDWLNVGDGFWRSVGVWPVKLTGPNRVLATPASLTDVEVLRVGP